MIRKCLFFILLLFIPFNVVYAKKYPKLVLSTYKIDFGKVSPDQKYVSRKVTLTNKGDVKLLIENYQTTCACTAVSDFPDYLIKPGKGFDFTVTLRVDGYKPGESALHYVTIVSNSKKSVTRIKVIAKIN